MHKFSLIIYLDTKLTAKIRVIQQELYKLTGSRACLDIWEPHLTIGSGIKVRNQYLAQLRKDFKSTLAQFQPFRITVRNYNFMDNWPGGKLPGHIKYVVYLDVIVSRELLHLAKAVDKVTRKYQIFWYRQPWPYKPHITVAYKDLSKEGFDMAKRLLRKAKFNGTTKIDHIALAEKNKQGIWKKYTKIEL